MMIPFSFFIELLISLDFSSISIVDGTAVHNKTVHVEVEKYYFVFPMWYIYNTYFSIEMPSLFARTEDNHSKYSLNFEINNEILKDRNDH